MSRPVRLVSPQPLECLAEELVVGQGLDRAFQRRDERIEEQSSDNGAERETTSSHENRSVPGSMNQLIDPGFSQAS